MRGSTRQGWTRLATALAVVLVALPPPAAASAACEGDSGHGRAALVELYTSEGCSSCPPADRALSGLADAAATGRVVPIELHVDYWDAIGWKDRFAQPSFAARQSWEVHANGHRTSYTPHFFVDGRELDDWRSDLGTSLRHPPTAATTRLTVRLEPDRAGHARIAVDRRPLDANVVDVRHRDLQLFMATTQSGLHSQVLRGENGGARLDHDFVVRNWIGPIDANGAAASIERTVDLPTGDGDSIAAVAFLQDARSGEVVQAVSTGLCATR